MSTLNFRARPTGDGPSALDGRLPPAPQAEARVTWLDAARGVGIVLVVLGHSLGGLMSGGYASFDGPFGAAFVLIYSFHMPLFFALSAMFLPDRLDRSYRRIAESALVRIAYPYLVWGTIQFLVIASLGRIVNTPVPFSWGALVALAWNPPSQFWFLYTLVLFQFAAILFHRFADLRVMLAVAVAVRILPEVVALPKILDMSLRYWIYYAAAANCAALLRERHTFDRISPPALAAVALAWLGAAYFAFLHGGDQSPADIPAAILGTVVFLKLALMARSGLRGALIWLGLRSMPIFVLHVLVVAGVRIALTHVLHVDAPLPILAVAVAAGLVLPAAVFDAAKKWGIAGRLALE